MLVTACDPLLGSLSPKEDPVHLGASAVGEPSHAEGAPQGGCGQEDAGAHSEGAALRTKAQ
eukprot:12895540-Alexandrium_andersonii.AAC.1